MNTFRDKFISAVRTHSWNTFGPRTEQRVICTVGTVTALGSSMYMGYSLGPETEYPVVGTVASMGMSVIVGFFAAYVAHIPIVAITSIPLLTAVSTGRMLKDFSEDKYTIHIGK